MPITMVGWDVSVSAATVDLDEAQSLRRVGTELATFCVDIQRVHSGGHRDPRPYVLADPLAMAIAINKDVATDVRRLFVAIETSSELCRGQTVVDHRNVLRQTANVDVVLEASHQLFMQMLYDAVQ